MSVHVNITKGFYRGRVIQGTFPLKKPYQEGARGGFITIENATPTAGDPPIQRITILDPADFKLVDASGADLASHITIAAAPGKKLEVTSNFEKAFLADETDQEAKDRIRSTFSMLDKIVDACAKNVIRGLIVTGPAGCGKSFGVQKQLDAANMFRKLKNQDPKYEFITGGVSAIGLYQKLYFNRSKEHVLVFDDCDDVLFDQEMLTLFKGAMNSADKRRICWNKESRVLKGEDIPEAFDFEGSIIFLTNIDFEDTASKDSRTADHLKAILSRCHYLDLEISSLRDQLLRIEICCEDGMLDSYGFGDAQQADIVKYVKDNAEYLREVSLRMTKKIADWVQADPSDWKEMAEATCLSRDAKFKRLQQKREAAKLGVTVNAV